MRRQHLLTGLVLVLAACGRGGDVPPPNDSARVAQAADTGSPAPAPELSWIGIYNYDARRPTFRPCEHALAFPLRGSDSLLAFLSAKIDFQAPRPILRIVIQAAGDTVRPDPYGPPVFTITAVGESHTPQPGECVAFRPAEAPPVREGPLRQAMSAAGVQGGGLRIASAYLDGDDKTDALVLLASGATCSPAGCDLFVFRGTEAGYALVSRTRHVKPPVMVREARNDGLRMLVVGVGQGGGFPDRSARLLNRAGRGYPIDAMVEPPGMRDPLALVVITPY